MKSFYLGKREYLPVLRLQSHIFHHKITRQSQVRRGETNLPLVADVNLLVEHSSPVYTLGRRDTSAGLSPLLERMPIIDPSSSAEVKRSGVASCECNGTEHSCRGVQEDGQAVQKMCASPFLRAQIVKTKRGGGITFHGPGQVTMYPIAQLEHLWKECKDEKKMRSPIEWFSGVLERSMQSTVQCFGIPTHPFKTGIWANAFECTEARKLGSIGLQLGSHWVSMHGAALNVSTDLMYFDQIIICELPGRSATSIEEEIKTRKLRSDANYRVVIPKGCQLISKSACSLSPSMQPISVDLVAPLLQHFFVEHLNHSNSSDWKIFTDLSSYPDGKWEEAVYESLLLPTPEK